MAIKSKTFLRRAEREDLDTIVAWMEDPDFLEFLYGDPERSPKQIREQIVMMLGRSSGQGLPTGIYLMLDSAEQGPIGLVSLQNISWRNRSCTIDLYLGGKQVRNRMVAAVAFYRAMEYCFRELNLNRVGAFIYSFNEASWRIIEKIGAVREVVVPQHVARHGQFYDMYCYGLLRREFEAFRQKHASATSGLIDNMAEEQRIAAAAAAERAASENAG